MYYGYNNNKQLILADNEFLDLLGYATFNTLLEDKTTENIKFENNKLTLSLSNKKIEANYTETKLHTSTEEITLVKLSNIIESSNNINNLQINYQPIYLDVTKISQEIGLSIDDYKLYLDSFIDQSIIDEKRLQDGDDRAIKNLSNLALTLKIPNINILLLKIKKLPKAERLPFVDEYYTKLALLTLKKPLTDANSETLLEADTLGVSKEEELNSTFTELLSNIEPPKQTANTPVQEELQPTVPVEPKIELDDNLLDDADIFQLEQQLEPLTEDALLDNTPRNSTLEQSRDEVPRVALENAKALPINYNPKVAADELNLPVVLIEEFVDDFIEQAHHDKDHLLASYYQKDMDNIHELGHKLKGAASNLRINELADVLEEIQFCTDHSKLEALFIKYWGLFISLEDYMKQSSGA
ncbi:MAG: Hpt domain-containing protein [Epsilonproteobacteria bacterium]|nr:Hpt domain-containing protein [Campylobacterota bacterium]